MHRAGDGDPSINEGFVPELHEQLQDLPPGIERRGARRVSGERSSRSSSREQGGLRIRLSDNELRAAQLIQERFQLRSTVAALGFCLRTMAQMVEQGQLGEASVADQLPQRGGRQPKPRTPAVRPDPLARPARQQAELANEDQPPEPAEAAEADVFTASATDSPGLAET